MYVTVPFTKITLEERSDPCGYCKEEFDENSKIKAHGDCRPFFHKKCLQIWFQSFVGDPSCFTCHKPIDPSSVFNLNKEIEKVLNEVESGVPFNNSLLNHQIFFRNDDEIEEAKNRLREGYAKFLVSLSFAAEEGMARGAVSGATIFSIIRHTDKISLATTLALSILAVYGVEDIEILHRKSVMLLTFFSSLSASCLTEIPFTQILTKVSIALIMHKLWKIVLNRVIISQPGLWYKKQFCVTSSLLVGAFVAMYSHILFCWAYSADGSGGLFFQSPPEFMCGSS